MVNFQFSIFNFQFFFEEKSAEVLTEVDAIDLNK
jgi:hypothetical protein